ncbi:ornithine cyclodeaminase family protein [Halobacteriales archaeon QS_4_62_28]|nr:MAG: ornithine cyclodeaminase family protein [Halobacteriales archaeon QS_4_62_28]
MKTALLGPSVVDEQTPLADVIDAVEAAFGAYARGDVVMPAKSYVDLPRYNGDFRSMPAYVAADAWDAAAVKWVNVHPDNPREHDLPTVLGTLIYSDPETAFPLAVMDGTHLTRKRTGAVAAVATDHLALPDATSMGLVGAGVQSYTQLVAISQVRDIETVVVADRNESAVEAFIEYFEDRFSVRGGTIAEAAACDVLSTVTPAEEPLVHSVGDHTHVNAIGADAPGKHEIADEVLTSATIVIDDYEQCTHSGEINVPWSAGVLTDVDIDAELGEIVVGDRPGRAGIDGVTVFDSTGLAIQDVACAHVAYENARDADAGVDFGLVGTDLSD